MLSLTELKTLLDTADLKNKCTYSKNTFLMYIDSVALDQQDLYTAYPVDNRLWVEYSDTTNKFTLQINYFNSLGDGISLQDFITGITPYPSTQPNNNMSVKFGQLAQIGIFITWTPPFAGSNVFTINIPSEMPDAIRRTWSSRYSTITKIA